MKSESFLKSVCCIFFVVTLLISCKETKTGQGGFESPSGNPITSDAISNAGLSGISSTVSLSTAEDNDEEQIPELEYTVYRVRQGDMIGILAEKFNLTQDTLISVNSIKQTRLIQIGQYLKIPSMPGILYTVRKDGETLDSIARKYEVNADKCAYVNKVSISQTLSAGTSLFIPDAELDWVTRQEINGDLFIRPIKGSYYFSSYFGWRNSPFTGQRSFHNGIDMAASRGTYIYPALSGVVTTVSYDNVYGNYVIVTHHSGYKTLYAHMSEVLTAKGRSVSTDTRIGRVGNTGMSTGDHLHFTIFKNGTAVNPVNLWR